MHIVYQLEVRLPAVKILYKNKQAEQVYQRQQIFCTFVMFCLWQLYYNETNKNSTAFESDV